MTRRGRPSEVEFEQLGTQTPNTDRTDGFQQGKQGRQPTRVRRRKPRVRRPATDKVIDAALTTKIVTLSVCTNIVAGVLIRDVSLESLIAIGVFGLLAALVAR